MKIAVILISIGIVIFLGAFGIIPFSIWKVLLWIIAITFIAGGVDALIRNFPSGLTSLSAGVILALILLKVISLGFWGFLAAVIGIWIVQHGLNYLIHGTFHQGWYFKIRRWK